MIIGLDVGGTHTDVVLVDRDGLQKEIKVATDPSDLFQSVLSGLDAVTADIDPAAINRIVLSTTLTTNAIVQNQIPPVGMIVSSGPGIDPEYYRTNYHGLRNVLPRVGKFAGGYFYRAAFGILDVHQLTVATPALTVSGPTEGCPGDPATFSMPETTA